MKPKNTFLSVTKRGNFFIVFFGIAFVLYSAPYPISAITDSYYKITQAVQLLGLVLMVIGGTEIIRFKFENNYLAFFYTLYISWLLFVILRSSHELANINFLKFFLFDPRNGGLMYFSPLFLLLPKNLFFYKKLFSLIILFGVFYIIYDSIFIKYLLSQDRTSTLSQGTIEVLSDYSFAIGFLLLTYAYHPKKHQLFGALIIILAIFFAVFRARRGLILMYGNMAILSYLLYLLSSRYSILVIYITTFSILLGALYFNSIYNLSENKIFGFLSDRATDDTRSIVELYFFNDMKPVDLFFGRGINGQYFCPGVDENQTTNYRSVIETGFLQIILKTGILSLILYGLIVLPAIYKGLFQSKNILSKAAAIWIFLSLINSYPMVFNSFTLQYILVWISVGICYSKSIRTIPDKKLRELFNSKLELKKK